MEKMKKWLMRETSTASSDNKEVSPFVKGVRPILSIGSKLYGLVISIRHQLYMFHLFRTHRLPIPVISVGNLTWGGNGKTPMVEYIARFFVDSGLSPLILTRGYAGGDEANMLLRHLSHTSTKIGIGPNRLTTATSFLHKYGYIDPHTHTMFDNKLGDKKIGVAILDDGMQHLRLWRDLEIVMVNGMLPWGNNRLLPLGPMREPITALRRADIAVIHHADFVSDENLKAIELMMRKVKVDLPIFYSRMAASYFFQVGRINAKIELRAVYDATILCVSSIGFANAFVLAIKKLRPKCVHQLEFSDHHLFHKKDIEKILTRLSELEHEHDDTKPIVVVTEKDYDRDPESLKELNPYKVLVLCSQLQITGCKEKAAESFTTTLKDVVERKNECKSVVN